MFKTFNCKEKMPNILLIKNNTQLQMRHSENVSPKWTTKTENISGYSGDI